MGKWNTSCIEFDLALPHEVRCQITQTGCNGHHAVGTCQCGRYCERYRSRSGGLNGEGHLTKGEYLHRLAERGWAQKCGKR